MLPLEVELATRKLGHPVHKYLVVTIAISTTDTITVGIINGEVVLRRGKAEVLPHFLVGVEGVRAAAPHDTPAALVDKLPCSLAAVGICPDLHLDCGLRARDGDGSDRGRSRG